MPASFDPNHVTKLQQLYSFITGVWGKCKSLFATKEELQEAIESIPDPLPEATSADEGKVLTVDSNGDPEWSEPPNPQVQADWSQTDSSAVDYIKNKPQNLVQDANYVHTDNNFTNADKSKLDGIEAGAEKNVNADWNASSGDAEILNKPENLVQDPNYVHTDNNYTNADKSKLDGIQAGAEANVQANWTQTNTSADDYIKNKPENLVQDASYVHTDNNFTTAEKNKLSGIAAGAEVNVQADWDQTNSSSDAFIKNKPATKTLLAGPGINVSENANAVTISTDNATEIAYFTVGSSAETDATNIAAAAAAGKRVILRVVDGNYTYDLPLSFWRAGEAFKFASWVDTYREFIKVLEYANGAWTWNATVKKTVVPNYSSSQANKILAVNAAGTSTEWKDAPSTTQVQADWSETDTSDPSYIQNKPQNLVQDASYVHTDNNFTTTLKNKLNGIAAGAEVNVQADWNQTNSSADDYIKNKPTIPTVPTTDQTYDAASSNPQSGTAVAGAIAGVNQVPASTSGDSGKVLTVNSSGSPEWQTGGGGGGGTVDQTYDPTSANAQSGTAVAGALATVNQVPAATSADEGKVLKVDANGDPEWATGGGGSQVQADWTQTDSTAVDYIKNKPNLAAVATSGSYNDLSNKPSLATVATSGSYNDLSNKPTIPTLASLNTAGITDIRVVSSMPSDPVSTVLYLVTG